MEPPWPGLYNKQYDLEVSNANCISQIGNLLICSFSYFVPPRFRSRPRPRTSRELLKADVSKSIKTFFVSFNTEKSERDLKSILQSNFSISCYQQMREKDFEVRWTTFLALSLAPPRCVAANIMTSGICSNVPVTRALRSCYYIRNFFS